MRSAAAGLKLSVERIGRTHGSRDAYRLCRAMIIAAANAVTLAVTLAVTWAIAEEEEANDGAESDDCY